MIVKFDRVSKTLDGSLVTDNISFELPEGKMMALLGPNGAGKTTSIRLLLGLYKADSGTVKVFGQEVDAGNSAEIRKNIGVQCDGNVYENLTVYDNLKLWGEIYGMSGETLENRITEMLEFFKLEEKRDVLAAKLSKGMKQKVNLARAIIHTPRLWKMSCNALKRLQIRARFRLSCALICSTVWKSTPIMWALFRKAA